jgi:hypothetical protein
MINLGIGVPHKRLFKETGQDERNMLFLVFPKKCRYLLIILLMPCLFFHNYWDRRTGNVQNKKLKHFVLFA